MSGPGCLCGASKDEPRIERLIQIDRGAGRALSSKSQPPPPLFRATPAYPRGLVIGPGL